MMTRFDNWLVPGAVALYMLALVGAIDAKRTLTTSAPIEASQGEPWLTQTWLLSDPADPRVASLQLRADLALARLIEARRDAE